MAYSKQFFTVATNDAPEVVSAIKAGLTAAGWTDAGGGSYTKTYDSTPLNVTITATTLDSSGRLAVVMNGLTFYLSAGKQIVAGNTVGLEFSMFEDIFYVKLTGPGPTTGGDATYGSPATSVLLTRYVPYTSANSNKADHWAAIGSPSAQAAWASASIGFGWNYQGGRAGLSGSNESIELATIRPAIQDDANVGDLLPSRVFGSGIIYSPFVIVGTNVGLIGRLRNVFFGSEAYLLTGDTVAHTDPTVYVGAVPYVTVTPHAYPTASASVVFSAYGRSNVLQTAAYGATGSSYYATPGSSGPYIIVRGGAL